MINEKVERNQNIKCWTPTNNRHGGSNIPIRHWSRRERKGQKAYTHKPRHGLINGGNAISKYEMCQKANVVKTNTKETTKVLKITHEPFENGA